MAFYDGEQTWIRETDNQVEKLVTELLNWMHQSRLPTHFAI